MDRKLAGAAAAAALLVCSGAANCRERTVLTDTQLDLMTAGYDAQGNTTSSSAPGNGVQTSTGGSHISEGHSINQNDIDALVAQQLAVFRDEPQAIATLERDELRPNR